MSTGCFFVTPFNNSAGYPAKQRKILVFIAFYLLHSLVFFFVYPLFVLSTCTMHMLCFKYLVSPRGQPLDSVPYLPKKEECYRKCKRRLRIRIRQMNPMHMVSGVRIMQVNQIIPSHSKPKHSL